MSDQTPKKVFVIYDDRAALGDTDAAQVLCCADSFKEAKRDVRDFGYGVIYEYDEVGNQLLNEVQRTWLPHHE